jgi:hypothetical protein
MLRNDWRRPGAEKSSALVVSWSNMSEDSHATPVTDSPWLWFALFSAVGLAALLATGGKFGKRQAGIERKYQARAAVASGQVQIEETSTGEKRAAGAPEYTTPEKPAIPVWPLEIILAVICAVSFGLLLKQRTNATRVATPKES